MFSFVLASMSNKINENKSERTIEITIVPPNTPSDRPVIISAAIK